MANGKRGEGTEIAYTDLTDEFILENVLDVMLKANINYYPLGKNFEEHGYGRFYKAVQAFCGHKEIKSQFGFLSKAEYQEAVLRGKRKIAEYVQLRYVRQWASIEAYEAADKGRIRENTVMQYRKELIRRYEVKGLDPLQVGRLNTYVNRMKFMETIQEETTMTKCGAS